MTGLNKKAVNPAGAEEGNLGREDWGRKGEMGEGKGMGGFRGGEGSDIVFPLMQY